MSRVDAEASRLRRLKRLGHRYGLTILTTKPMPKTGGYMLTLDASRQVLMGDKPQPFSASLDQIEVHIDDLVAKGNA